MVSRAELCWSGRLVLLAAACAWPLCGAAHADSSAGDLEKLLEGPEKALAEAATPHAPNDAAVRKAEADLRAAQEQVKDALLKDLLPAVRKLEAEHDGKVAKGTPPDHPDFEAMVVRIVTQRNRLWRLGQRIRASLTDEERKALGILPPLVVDLGGDVKMEFVAVPPGEFQMGSDSGNKDERPVHRVWITKPFYIGKFEVTQAQWQALMGRNPSRFKGARNPVECVSWFDSAEFLQKLAAKVPEGLKCSLPTETEWEYCCRAGTTTTYSFGDDEKDLADHAWYTANSDQKAHPVGEKKPNPWGLYDMYGNCWEWCQDMYSAAYPAGDRIDPPASTSGKVPVLRGGSWFRDAESSRSACRYKATPQHRNGNLGLRVVLRSSVD